MMTNARARRARIARRHVMAVLSVTALVGCGEPSADRTIQPSYDETGRLQLLTFDSNANGRPDTWSHMEGSRLIRVDIDRDEDGLIDRWEYYDARRTLEKVGTSQRGNGEVDTWTYAAPDGTIARIESATKGDGRITRTEFYEGGVLARAEEDGDGDGTVDKWETYANGVVSSVAFDTEGAGRPTRRLVYDANGRTRIETSGPATVPPVSKR